MGSGYLTVLLDYRDLSKVEGYLLTRDRRLKFMTRDDMLTLVTEGKEDKIQKNTRIKLTPGEHFVL